MSSLKSKQPEAQLGHTKKYSGIRRWAGSQFGNQFFQMAAHVKAHISDAQIAAIDDEDMQAIALSNKRVDLLAKEALALCHPRVPLELAKNLDNLTTNYQAALDR